MKNESLSFWGTLPEKTIYRTLGGIDEAITIAEIADESLKPTTHTDYFMVAWTKSEGQKSTTKVGVKTREELSSSLGELFANSFPA